MAEIALTFLRLGTTAFGGPAAHIAMMRQEFVERRRWLTDEEYVDMIGVTNLVPGPNSTEVAIHVGYRRGGWIGLLLAGVCFILPAALIVAVIAAGYKSYGSLPEVRKAIYGIKPAVIAIIVQALWGLARTVLKRPLSIFLAILSGVCGWLTVMPLIPIFGSGVLAAGLEVGRERDVKGTKPLVVLLGSVALVAAIPWGISALPWAGSGSLFIAFLKIGSVLYGSGYVLLAFLKAEFVRTHLLTQSQLLDAIAVGQFTPGPVFTTATFIGYLLGGPVGALLATVGIFLPAFLFVAMSGKYLRSLRDNPVTAAFLDGVNASAIGLIAAVAIQLGREAIVDVTTALIAAISLALLLKFKFNSAWLILAAAALGFVLPG